MKPTLTNYIRNCNDRTLKAIRNLVNAEYNRRGENSGRGDTIKLTKRQLDVLKLCCYSKYTTAEKLYISETTVATHYIQILKKLGSENKTEAILKAIKSGLIKLDEIELP